jgi:hypothetical protein
MMAVVSTPVGRVPNAMPQSSPNRVAQKASATAGWPWRTSWAPWRISAMSSMMLETLTNATAARRWLVAALGEDAVARSSARELRGTRMNVYITMTTNSFLDYRPSLSVF